MWIWFSVHNYLLVISFSGEWAQCNYAVTVRNLLMLSVSHSFVGFLIGSLWWSVWRGIKGLCGQCSSARPCCFLGQWSRSVSLSGQMGWGVRRVRELLACLSAGGICESAFVFVYMLPGRVLICSQRLGRIVCPPRRATWTNWSTNPTQRGER